ncbi:MAG: family 1 glycosylhydrolase [Coriobacteriia bacterium]|nr:family 1 glycosylhydrolase [Coriobacteriia bacterium]
MDDLVFPAGFLWGASTSAHQIEGGNIHSDWWAWEQAGRVAEKSGRACDSWNRWREDLDLAASLGLSVFRISVEWARIEPEPGHFDIDVLAHYAEVLRGIHERGMLSMVVLWHFTHPEWFSQGGAPWLRPDAATAFGRYARRVAEAMGEHVDLWATLNEANTCVEHAFVTGDWPPGRTGDYVTAYRSYRGLAAAHHAARGAIRDVLGPQTSVGLTHVMPWAHPAAGSWGSGLRRRLYHWEGAHAFLSLVGSDLDWLGVQYYYDAPMTLAGIDDDDGDPPRTDMGWRIYPQGLHGVLHEAWTRYRVPMIVTENGLADAADVQRGRFLLDHIAWTHRAIEEGVPVLGYLHWSLIDNFEWAHGFGPRFGLAEVDHDTFVRTPRPSAALYAQIARGNRVTPAMGAGLTYADGTSTLGPR